MSRCDPALGVTTVRVGLYPGPDGAWQTGDDQVSYSYTYDTNR